MKTEPNAGHSVKLRRDYRQEGRAGSAGRRWTWDVTWLRTRTSASSPLAESRVGPITCWRRACSWTAQTWTPWHYEDLEECVSSAVGNHIAPSQSQRTGLVRHSTVMLTLQTIWGLNNIPEFVFPEMMSSLLGAGPGQWSFEAPPEKKCAANTMGLEPCYQEQSAPPRWAWQSHLAVFSPCNLQEIIPRHLSA